VIQKILYKLPNKCDNLSEQPRTELPPKRIILWLFWALFLHCCFVLSLG